MVGHMGQICEYFHPTGTTHVNMFDYCSFLKYFQPVMGVKYFDMQSQPTHLCSVLVLFLCNIKINIHYNF